LFVGDFNYGNLYHFKLNEDRTGLLLPSDGPLADKVANALNETKGIIFGTGFGGPTALFYQETQRHWWNYRYRSWSGWLFVYPYIPSNTRNNI
jgi:hypothetical protein